ncbi:MAG TPA: helix-turn-helix transcriptional regulator, partial [Actinomycetota bacterium]
MRQVLPLRDHRLARGWSLDDVSKRLAELGRECGEDNLGVNGLMVGRWERGERRPAPPYPKLLCVLYQATAWELGIVEGFHNAEPHGRLEDVERREVLHLLSVALAAPVLLRGEAEVDRLA